MDDHVDDMATVALIRCNITLMPQRNYFHMKQPIHLPGHAIFQSFVEMSHHLPRQDPRPARSPSLTFEGLRLEQKQISGIAVVGR